MSLGLMYEKLHLKYVNHYNLKLFLSVRGGCENKRGKF